MNRFRLLLLTSLLFGARFTHAAQHPNPILVLADDLGWADLGRYGNTFDETTNIDRLAREGMRFTQFYAGLVCSPTRANLQSGRDQALLLVATMFVRPAAADRVSELPARSLGRSRSGADY